MPRRYGATSFRNNKNHAHVAISGATSESRKRYEPVAQVWRGGNKAKGSQNRPESKRENDSPTDQSKGLQHIRPPGSQRGVHRWGSLPIIVWTNGLSWPVSNQDTSQRKEPSRAGHLVGRAQPIENRSSAFFSSDCT